jgi:hypothetical protein
MTSGREAPNVVALCGISSGVKVVHSPGAEEAEAGVVPPTKQTQTASGDNSEIPVIFPVVTGVKPERRTKTSVQLADGMMTPRETSEPEQSLVRICMIPVLMQLLEFRVAGEQVHLGVS